MDKGSYVIMNLLQLYLDCAGNMLYLLWGSCTFWEVHTVCFAEINQQYFYLLHVSLVLVGIKLFSSFGNGGGNREREKRES